MAGSMPGPGGNGLRAGGRVAIIPAYVRTPLWTGRSAAQSRMQLDEVAPPNWRHCSTDRPHHRFMDPRSPVANVETPRCCRVRKWSCDDQGLADHYDLS